MGGQQPTEKFIATEESKHPKGRHRPTTDHEDSKPSSSKVPTTKSKKSY